MKQLNLKNVLVSFLLTLTLGFISQGAQAALKINPVLSQTDLTHTMNAKVTKARVNIRIGGGRRFGGQRFHGGPRYRAFGPARFNRLRPSYRRY